MGWPSAEYLEHSVFGSPLCYKEGKGLALRNCLEVSMRWHLQKMSYMMDIQILAITGASPSTMHLSANKSSFVSFLEKLVQYILTCNAIMCFWSESWPFVSFFLMRYLCSTCGKCGLPLRCIPPSSVTQTWRMSQWRWDRCSLEVTCLYLFSTCQYENRGKSYFTFISYNFVLCRKNLGARRMW